VDLHHQYRGPSSLRNQSHINGTAKRDTQGPGQELDNRAFLWGILRGYPLLGLISSQHGAVSPPDPLPTPYGGISGIRMPQRSEPREVLGLGLSYALQAVNGAFLGASLQTPLGSLSSDLHVPS
jgi:hypothetical protein